jgi:hypothetical protein
MMTLSRLGAVHSPRDFFHRLIFCLPRSFSSQISQESVTRGSEKPTPDQQNLDWCLAGLEEHPQRPDSTIKFIR